MSEEMKKRDVDTHSEHTLQMDNEECDLLVNDDSWHTREEVAEFTSGLPSASQAIYNSPVIRNSTPFTHVRFSVTKTYGDRNYFNLAEFMLFDVQIDVFDPEA